MVLRTAAVCWPSWREQVFAECLRVVPVCRAGGRGILEVVCDPALADFPVRINAYFLASCRLTELWCHESHGAAPPVVNLLSRTVARLELVLLFALHPSSAF